jgi:hypothetical protein
MKTSYDERERGLEENLEKVENRVPIRQLAAQYDIPESAIRGRRNGRQNARMGQENKRLLSSEQEKDLVYFLLPEEADGRGLSQHKTRQIVTEIINPESNDITVGKNWALRFAKRHKELNSMYTTHVEATRSIYATPGTLRPFILRDVIAADERARCPAGKVAQYG